MNNPPIAEKITTEIKLHGKVINDPYSWLRDPKWPNVTDQKILSYLTTENEYYNSFFEFFFEIFNEVITETSRINIT